VNFSSWVTFWFSAPVAVLEPEVVVVDESGGGVDDCALSPEAIPRPIRIAAVAVRNLFVFGCM
jgi:hypothetical protein